jgi:polyisoprenoid-binding protein YceI
MKKLFLLAVLVAFAFASVYAKECNVNKEKKNLVKFISDAPIEDFEGTTDKIDGYIMIEGMESLVGGEMYFEVDLNSLDTGIGLRNRHMRENYLHTDKYPMTNFEGKIIEAEKETADRSKVKVKGKIFIHGKTKELTAEGYITTNHSGSYRIQTKFVVNLTDFDIEVPQIMVMKIDEEMDMVLDFYVKEIEG